MLSHKQESKAQPNLGRGAVATTQQISSKLRLENTNAKVDEVVDIMNVNVLERDEKLSVMETRADALKQGASQFENHARTLKRRALMRNMKMWIVIGAIAFIGLLVIGSQLNLF
ncbi:vesicle-associated membrane protein 2 [Folsomia candida]|uniref:vesicle-associated membrane protein 2 n=1 Tax=Folsomia candida TaxID=158441 RepID=UPI000B8FCE9F|nr:vesicle-associated membrane protein 2 [Folsomia candida]